MKRRSTLGARRLTRRDIRFASAGTDEDLALLNGYLVLEGRVQPGGVGRVERPLTICQFEDRLRTLPKRAFARATLDLYAVGWIDHHSRS